MTGMKLEVGMAKGLGNTERWFTNTIPIADGCSFFNSMPRSFKDPFKGALKALLNTRLKNCLTNQAFYDVDEFLTFDWETAQLTD